MIIIQYMNSFFKKFMIGEWNFGIYNQNFIVEFRKIKIR